MGDGADKRDPRRPGSLCGRRLRPGREGGRGRSADPLLGEAPTPAPGPGSVWVRGRARELQGRERAVRAPGRARAPVRTSEGMSRSSPGAGDPAATWQSCPPLFLRCALDTRSGPQPRTTPRWLVSWTMMLFFFFFPSRLGSHPGSLQSTQLQKCCSGHLTHVACISPPATALGRPVRVLQVQNRALGAYRSLP